MIKFYDTNALLQHYETIKFDSKIIISNLTLKEIQSIKQNFNKDFEIKYKARHLINWLIKNKQYYQIQKYQKQWDSELKNYPILNDDIDSKIILSALKLNQKFDDFYYISYELFMYCIGYRITNIVFILVG